MTELQKLLDRAYLNLSKINVSGETVILMAGIMQDLKLAYKLTQEKGFEQEKEED